MSLKTPDIEFFNRNCVYIPNLLISEKVFFKKKIMSFVEHNCLLFNKNSYNYKTIFCHEDHCKGKV